MIMCMHSYYASEDFESEDEIEMSVIKFSSLHDISMASLTLLNNKLFVMFSISWQKF